MTSIVGSYFDTVNSVMGLMAPFAGGAVPDINSTEYANWMMWIQQKYEEASRRGFWRRLLVESTLSLTKDDEVVYLPVDFQRNNSLYILVVDEIDLCDPDRTPDGQSIFVSMDTSPTVIVNGSPVTNSYFGRWKIRFGTPISATQTAPIWYFCAPPKPTAGADKLLLPGDMLSYGALIEYFRGASLPGSQDDARIEFENRMNDYQAMEVIPSRYEILKFVTNPRGLDRSQVAKSRYAIRPDRVGSGG